MDPQSARENQLTRRRCEAKYIVPVPRLREVARRIPAVEIRAYDLLTVYLDRPDGTLARTALETPSQCVKIRMRKYFDGLPFLWVEVKSRRGPWTRKSRFKIHEGETTRILGDPPAARRPLLDCACRQCLRDATEAYDHFREVADGRLLPIGGVKAQRQMLRVRRGPLRFSLDRKITYFRVAARRSGLPLRLGAALFHEPRAVLELKYSGNAPAWCSQVVSGLEASNYSKFSTLVRCMSRARALTA